MAALRLRRGRSGGAGRGNGPGRSAVDVDALVAAGRLLDAIELLSAENRAERDPAKEQRLVELRHAAFATLEPATAIEQWPPPCEDLFAGVEGIPEVHAGDLTPAAVRSGILAHGSLIVRELLRPEHVARLVRDIDEAFTAYDAHSGGVPIAETAPWFVPIDPGAGYKLTPREWVRDGGGVLGADSPRALFDLIEIFTEVGIVDVLEGHLGERPALSVKKCTLRKVPVDTGTDWHQDGAFMGADLRTVNVWVALTDCGDDAPGLDVFPHRYDRVLETGTEGALFDWSVGEPVARRAAPGVEIVRPLFRAGDAMLFDDLCVHRTGVSPGMTRERYAIEAWFFAPSAYPHHQIPIVF
jgi:hypothetical protein